MIVDEITKTTDKACRFKCEGNDPDKSQLEVKSRTFVNSTRSNYVQSEHGFKPLDRRGKWHSDVNALGNKNRSMTSNIGNEKGDSQGVKCVNQSPALNKTLSEQGSDHNWHGGSENAYHLLYDKNYAGVDDKFVSSIMHMHNKVKDWSDAQNKTIFKKWSQQSEFRFGFVPLDNQILLTEKARCDLDMNPIEMHHYVKCTGCPNYMHARIPVKSQLNIEAWHDVLSEYWDQQLLELIEFGFPLDFNRNCPLNHENANHKSATQFPGDVEAYIAEELKFGALLSPFAENPIPRSPVSFYGSS